MKKGILIVDDTKFMRILIKDILSSSGYNVVGEAVNGAEAVEKYVSLSPELVTMDISMPGMTGIEALKKIIEIDEFAKVVMCSSLGHQSIISQTMLVGAKAFIVKPFQRQEFEKIIRDVLNSDIM